MPNHHLLKSPLAVQLYESCARDLPIIDYQHHTAVDHR